MNRDFGYVYSLGDIVFLNLKNDRGGDLICGTYDGFVDRRTFDGSRIMRISIDGKLFPTNFFLERIDIIKEEGRIVLL